MTSPRTDETIATGFPSIDNALGGGFRTGDLVVLGGDVGSGKSALALAIALRARESSREVCFLTSEMSPVRVRERALAIRRRVRVDDLRRDPEAQGGRDARASVTGLPDDETLGVAEMPTGGVSAIGELVNGEVLHLVVIDPLQALAVGEKPLDEEIATAVRELKRLAVNEDVVLLALSGLPDMPRDRSDKRPQLGDFGALGAIKQHADIVLGLFREEMYEASLGVDGATELIILKNRNGPRGYVDLYFYKQWMRFEDVLEPDR